MSMPVSGHNRKANLVSAPDTTANSIVALSSGVVPSGVAIIRVSGPACLQIIETFLVTTPEARKATLAKIYLPDEEKPLDEGLAVWFPAPNSFTGEDCLELQVHGSRVVVADLLEALCKLDNVRTADAGEFSRRAFENGKMDLTAIEGLADLIAAETREQRLQAYGQHHGNLRELYDSWRQKLIHLRAMIEAEFDFSEEEDVPEEIAEQGFLELKQLISEIETHMDDKRAGEIIRDGFQIVLLGKPNAGKSSLLNALSKRDVAIVTDEPGTTRDIISVDLDIDGYAVRITDTAGLRESDNKIEQEGIKRAIKASDNADLVLWLQALGDEEFGDRPELDNLLTITSKDDLGSYHDMSVSSETGHGIDKLLEAIASQIKSKVSSRESGLISRQRYRENLAETLLLLNKASEAQYGRKELQSEDLRNASHALGKITGLIDIEDLLDVIFSEFCVGK